MSLPGLQRVKLYAFFIVAENRYGLPFALCAYHLDVIDPPVLRDGRCRLERIADTTDEECNQCLGVRLGI